MASESVAISDFSACLSSETPQEKVKKTKQNAIIRIIIYDYS
jgi:hypothetical protein